MPTTSNRHTYKLQLPAFMLNTAVTLFDFYSVKRALAEDSTRTGLIRRAQFHLLNFLGLCKACDCSGTTLCTCLNCGELWDKFLQDTGRRVPDKAQLPAALDAWRVWDSMLISVCNSRSCAWVLNALCMGLIEQQLAMLHWLKLIPGSRSPSLLVIV